MRTLLIQTALVMALLLPFSASAQPDTTPERSQVVPHSRHTAAFAHLEHDGRCSEHADRLIASELSLPEHSVHQRFIREAAVRAHEFLLADPDVNAQDCVSLSLYLLLQRSGEPAPNNLLVDLVRAHPDSVYTADAVLLLAESNLHRGRYVTAARLFEGVVALSPHHPSAARAHAESIRLRVRSWLR